MRLFAIVLLSLFAINPSKGQTPTTQQKMDYIQQQMEDARRRVDRDMGSEKGRLAIEFCKGRLNITEDVKNAVDVERYHNSRKSTAFAQCVVDRMYPP